MTCKDCRKPIRPGDEGMAHTADDPQCQLCWEAECDAAWWQMLTVGPLVVSG